VIDTRGERAIPTLARRARVQRPLEVGVGSVGIAATDEDLIATVALRGLEYRRRRERVTVRTDDRERQQADRQTALGRDALELGARGILGGTRARRRASSSSVMITPGYSAMGSPGTPIPAATTRAIPTKLVDAMATAGTV